MLRTSPRTATLLTSALLTLALLGPLLLAACASPGGDSTLAEPSPGPPGASAPAATPSAAGASPTPSSAPPAPDLVPVLRSVKGHESCATWLNTVPGRPGVEEYHIGVTIEVKGLDGLPDPHVTVGVRRDGVNNFRSTYEFGQGGIPKGGAQLYPDAPGAYYIGTSDELFTVDAHPAKDLADKTVELTIEVDVDNRVHEPFENNNVIRVKVHTPPGDKPALGRTRCVA